MADIAHIRCSSGSLQDQYRSIGYDALDEFDVGVNRMDPAREIHTVRIVDNNVMESF